jgi:hypothetical protein
MQHVVGGAKVLQNSNEELELEHDDQRNEIGIVILRDGPGRRSFVVEQ